MAIVGPYLTDLPEERIARYRLMAANAREAAHNSTTTEAIEIYMAIATAWETMAVELQHGLELKPRLQDQLSHGPDQIATTSLTKSP